MSKVLVFFFKQPMVPMPLCSLAISPGNVFHKLIIALHPKKPKYLIAISEVDICF